MKAKEAIASLRTLCHTCEMFPKCVNDKPECFQAIELAISALQAQDEEQREEPLYCDRDICLRNDYNGIGCGDCEVTKSQQQAKHGDGLDEAIWRLENISEYQSAEAERWDHSFDDYSGVKRDEYLKWSDEHRQLASWLKELKRLRTEVYFLKAERENAPVDLFGDLPCKTCRWEAETTEKCEECIDGITDNYEAKIECEDCVSRKAAIDAMGKAQWAKERLMELPSAEPEIIRCKDCKYRGGLSGFYCDIVEKAVGVDSFCSWAERRTDEAD